MLIKLDQMGHADIKPLGSKFDRSLAEVSPFQNSDLGVEKVSSNSRPLG